MLCSTLAFTEREYLSSGINMLTSNLKIFETTKTEFLELDIFQSDQKIWQKYCRADVSSLSHPLTCWLSQSVLKQGLFGHLSNCAFCSLYFLKQITSEAHLFFLKYFKFYIDCGNPEKNSENIFWFWDNCIWIGFVKNYLFLGENTCHWVSIC